MSFFARLKLALAIVFGRVPPPTPPALPAAPVQPQLPAPPSHAPALFALGLLQREGRLLDFLREDISGFTDAEVGAAARVVHQGCRKSLDQYLTLAPVVPEAEGAVVTVPAGFDANRFRLTGNVTGAGPWRGTLKHHGWVATRVALPQVPTSVDLAVLAAAEVELP